MATERKVYGGKYRILTNEDTQAYDRVSLWTSARDVEFNEIAGFEGSNTLQGRLGSIKGRTAALNMEETGYVADATALKKVNDKVGNINIKVKDGYLYFTDANGVEHKLNFSGQVQLHPLGNFYEDNFQYVTIPAGVNQVTVAIGAGTTFYNWVIDNKNGSKWYDPYVYVCKNLDYGYNRKDPSDYDVISGDIKTSYIQNGMMLKTYKVSPGDEIMFYYNYEACAEEIARDSSQVLNDGHRNNARQVFGARSSYNKYGYVFWTGGSSDPINQPH